MTHRNHTHDSSLFSSPASSQVESGPDLSESETRSDPHGRDSRGRDSGSRVTYGHSYGFSYSHSANPSRSVKADTTELRIAVLTAVRGVTGCDRCSIDPVVPMAFSEDPQGGFRRRVRLVFAVDVPVSAIAASVIDHIRDLSPPMSGEAAREQEDGVTVSISDEENIGIARSSRTLGSSRGFAAEAESCSHRNTHQETVDS